MEVLFYLWYRTSRTSKRGSYIPDRRQKCKKERAKKVIGGT
jgi:hypothetical protein